MSAVETTDLGALLDAGEDALVTLVAGQTRLVAHRAVLSDRSPAMFGHDMLEASSGQVDVAGVEGPVLRQLVRRLYTLRPPQPSGTCWQQPTESPTMSAVQTTDLGALLDDGEDALVTLVAGETRLVAHRAVLTDRSPVFSAMFAHDMLEASSGQVDIKDVEGPVLRQLLAFLYTLRPPQPSGTARHLLAAADKYGVDSLKAACEQQVAAQLTVGTAADAALLAVRHCCQSLRQDVVKFIEANPQVMVRQAWAEAVCSHPEVSQLLVDPPVDTSVPAPAAPRRSRRLPPLPPPDAAAVARLRSLPVDERSRRLREAAKAGAVGELEALLAAGADVAAGDLLGMTALHCAALCGHVEAARRLLAWGALVGARDYAEMTPLHEAAMEGNAAVARLLLAHSADHSARDSEGWTPLHEAASTGNAAVVRLLLAASADHSARDSEGWTPLHCAASTGHREAAAALLQAGADRAARSNSGKTPLDIARRRNHQQLVELLATTML